MKEVNAKAEKVTWKHQDKMNRGGYVVNRCTMERQGNKLGWYVNMTAQVIRHRNKALVSVS